MSEPSSPPARKYAPFTLSQLFAFMLIVGIAVNWLYWAVRSERERLAEEAAPVQVRAVLDSQVEAWNRGDLEGFMASYWNSDELEFRSGGTVTKGWQATLDRYRKRYQSEGKEMGRLSFPEVDVEVFGPNKSLVRGRYKLVTSKETLEGLFTLLARRFDDGWKIVYDHTSAADPPKPEKKD